ncbi:MAG: RHS repeat-associated core domain-containing protein, partial [Cyanobacteria bacterium J06649_11]
LDGNTSGTDYQYDGSGNMIDDMNKGIDVLYNHLNKPTSVQKGTQIIQYIYSADGTKLRQKVTTSEPLPGQSAISKITDYVNGYEYEDPDGGGNASSKELVHIMHTKGRMVYDAPHDSYTYEYFLQDHLGNTRVVFSDQNRDGRINPDPLNGTDIRQIVEGYYPFGAQHNTDQSIVIFPENQYLYNGKELQDELNLGWYDYGARMYDPTVGRWNGVDALAEKYLTQSPYNYTVNNPIIYIDPDGRSVSLSTLIENAWGATPENGSATFTNNSSNDNESDIDEQPQPDPIVDQYRHAYENVFGGGKNSNIGISKASEQVEYFFTHNVGNADANVSLEIHAIVLMALFGDDPERARLAVNQIQKSDHWLYRWTSAELSSIVMSFSGIGAARVFRGVILETHLKTVPVWKLITITQASTSRTLIPHSFKMFTSRGSFWVAPNATKHMVQYAKVVKFSHGQLVIQQAMLSSFNRAVSAAARQGIKYNQVMNVGGWELIFSPARQAGQLPVIKHALYLR